MAYATAAQVAAEAKVSGGFLDAVAGPPAISATNPTLTKVGEIIAEVEATVNAKVANKYVTPVTVAGNILILRGIVLALCVERVREIMEVRTGAANAEQIQWKTTADQARKDIQAIIAGQLPLTGEVLANSPYDGVKSHAITSGQQPVFKKGCVQW